EDAIDTVRVDLRRVRPCTTNLEIAANVEVTGLGRVLAGAGPREHVAAGREEHDVRAASRRTGVPHGVGVSGEDGFAERAVGVRGHVVGGAVDGDRGRIGTRREREPENRPPEQPPHAYPPTHPEPPRGRWSGPTPAVI